MHRGVALVVLSLVVGGPAGAGIYSPPPGDHHPVWSHDGSAIVFYSEKPPHGLRVMSPTGGGVRRLPLDVDSFSAFELARDWSWVAYHDFTPDGPLLTIARPEGHDVRVVGPSQPTSRPSWSPDGSHVAYVAAGEPTVRTVSVEGEQQSLSDGFHPAWSPNGLWIAFLRRTGDAVDLAVVNADGSDLRVLAEELRVVAPLTWSPESSRIAAISSSPGGAGTLHVVDALDGARRSVALQSPPSRAVWRPDGNALLLSGLDVREYTVASGKMRLLRAEGFDAEYSPDGHEIVFSARGECRDRLGVYRAAATGYDVVRLTDDCRLRGTDGADRITGTSLFDVIQGLGGDDQLSAWDPGYLGDDLEGGAGDDSLVGGYRPNRLEGGAGNDRLEGLAGGDMLTGGTGRDVLLGGGGVDTLHAVDGQRDRVSCGTHQSPNSAGREADVAHVDAVDRVSPDCEIVRNRRGAIIGGNGPANLTIRVWPRGVRGRSRVATLRCEPPGGTLPRAAAACRDLTLSADPFAPVPKDTACTSLFGGPQVARVTGRFRGGRVVARFDRSDGCQIARWNRLAFLFVRR